MRRLPSSEVVSWHSVVPPRRSRRWSFAALFGISGAAAVEAVNVRVDAAAIDLTDAVEFQRTDGDRVQVSTAPGPDGIVRRIEVRAREAGTQLGGVRARQ